MTACPCGEWAANEDEAPEGLDEILDLIAEAARTSVHAARAYSLLGELYSEGVSLNARQMLIAGRMKDVA